MELKLREERKKQREANESAAAEEGEEISELLEHQKSDEESDAGDNGEEKDEEEKFHPWRVRFHAPVIKGDNVVGSRYLSDQFGCTGELMFFADKKCAFGKKIFKNFDRKFYKSS